MPSSATLSSKTEAPFVCGSGLRHGPKAWAVALRLLRRPQCCLQLPHLVHTSSHHNTDQRLLCPFSFPRAKDG